MTFRLRTLAFSLLIFSNFLTTACEDKGEDPQVPPTQTQPPPTTPTPPVTPPSQKTVVKGIVQPANSVVRVSVSRDGSGWSATPNSDGEYTFNNLATGTYMLIFVAAQGYERPALQSITVGTGLTTIPTFTMVATPPPLSPVSYLVDGVKITPDIVRADSTLGTFQVSCLNGEAGFRGNNVHFIFNGAPITVGTHSLTAGRSLFARVTTAEDDYYDTQKGASGTLTITSVSTSPRRMSGTFSFVATEVFLKSTSPLTKVVTDGKFSNVPY